nr:LCP family protein [Streptomyces sp. DSM 41633]
DASFERLKETLHKLDVERGTSGNHAFYLSIPPKAFPQVCEQLSKSGLADKPEGSWSRVVIEKPFGHDLKSAEELNAVVNSVFPESSVFRIDHYLEIDFAGFKDLVDAIGGVTVDVPQDINDKASGLNLTAGPQKLDGTETYDITGIEELNKGKTPKTVKVTATKEDGSKVEFDAVVRIDTPGEADYYRNGG